MDFRKGLRMIPSVFELYKQRTVKYPQQANYFNLMFFITATLVVGKGAENLVCRHP